MSFSRAAMLFLGLTPAQTRAKDQRPLDSIFCSHAPNRLGRHAPAPPFLFKLSQGGAGALVLNRRTALLLVLWPDRPPCPGAPGNGSLFRSERSLNNSPVWPLAADSQPCAPAYSPRSFLCTIVLTFVATRYLSASAASSPPMPSSSASTFKTSSGRFGSCCNAGNVSTNRPHRL